jgi:hypothetical protein
LSNSEVFVTIKRSELHKLCVPPNLQKQGLKSSNDANQHVTDPCSCQVARGSNWNTGKSHDDRNIDNGLSTKEEVESDEERPTETEEQGESPVGDLPRTMLSDVDRLLEKIFGDHGHQNYETHLSGGIADDTTGQHSRPDIQFSPRENYQEDFIYSCQDHEGGASSNMEY